MLNGLDWGIIALVSISALLGAWGGGVRVLLSLVSWVVAWWCAGYFSARVAQMLPPALAGDGLRHVVAVVVLFLVVLVLMSVLASLVTMALKAAGLGAANHWFGLLSGALRGMFIVVLLVLAAGFTALPGTLWWRSSHLVFWFIRPAQLAARSLPVDWARHLHYRE